jgi:signal transduction histidine kinase
MTDDHTGAVSVQLARYPGPVCVYGLDAGEAVVRRVNDPFETQLAAVDAGTSVAAAFDSLGIDIDAEADVEALLGSDEQFSVTVEDSGGSATTERYLVQPIPPEESQPGTLLFTDMTATGTSFGVNNVASVVSHELRNPLDVAKTRLRAGRELNEDDHFDHVEQAHDRMERIIQDVLTLARGSDVVDPNETVALDAVAERAWETVETGDATLTIADPLPTTIADTDRVSRLFENLFRNAVEHGSMDGSSGGTAEGNRSTGVDVTVGRLSDDPASGFYVADDGSGIPASEREHVFEPGYSSDDHGTGLGLAIVDRIADLHGWTSAVTAAESGGARVEIRGVEPTGES